MGFYDRMRYENRFDSLNEALSKEERATLQKLLGKMSDRDKKNLLNSKSSKSSSKTSSDSSTKKLSKEAIEFVESIVDGYKDVIKQIKKAAATAKSDEKKKEKIDRIIDDEDSVEYGNDNVEYELYYAPFEDKDDLEYMDCSSYVRNNEGGYVIALDTNSLNSNYRFDDLGDLDDYEFYFKYCRKEVVNSLKPLCEDLFNTLGNGWRVQLKDLGMNVDLTPVVIITYKASRFEGAKSASGSAAGNIQSKIVEAIKFLENKQSYKMPALKAAVSKFFDGTGVVMFGGEMYEGGRTVKGTDGKSYNILKMNFGNYKGPSAGPYGEDTHGFGFAIPGKVKINIENIYNACLEDVNKDSDFDGDEWFNDIFNIGDQAAISVGYAEGNTYVLIFESSM